MSDFSAWLKAELGFHQLLLRPFEEQRRRQNDQSDEQARTALVCQRAEFSIPKQDNQTC